MIGALLGVLFGGVLNICVAHFYHKKASACLRWEARAGAIEHRTLELLVAYVDWGQDLRPGQGISIGGSDNQPSWGILDFGCVLKLLSDAGLAVRGAHGYGREIGSRGEGPIPKGYSTLFVTNEGRELAGYIKSARGVESRVVALFGTPPGGEGQGSNECLWTIVPGKKPGPIDEFWKHSES